RSRLTRSHAAAAGPARPVTQSEPALKIRPALGRDRRSVLASLLKVPALGAMAMLLPAALWSRHHLRHPLGERFEGFPDFVPEEVTPAQIEAAHRQVTPELLSDAIFAGSVAEGVAEVRPLIDAGVRHIVIWNVGPLATGGAPTDIVRLARLIRRLRRIGLPAR